MTTTTDHAVLAVFDDLYKAWADNDADAFVASFTEDATSILPGSFRESRAVTRDKMAAAFAGPFKDTTVRDEVQSVRYLGPDTAVVISKSVILMPGDTEPPANRWILATWVLTRRDDKWLLAAYHNCPA